MGVAMTTYCSMCRRELVETDTAHAYAYASARAQLCACCSAHTLGLTFRSSIAIFATPVGSAAAAEVVVVTAAVYVQVNYSIESSAVAHFCILACKDRTSNEISHAPPPLAGEEPGSATSVCVCSSSACVSGSCGVKITSTPSYRYNRHSAAAAPGPSAAARAASLRRGGMHAKRKFIAYRSADSLRTYARQVRPYAQRRDPSSTAAPHSDVQESLSGVTAPYRRRESF